MYIVHTYRTSELSADLLIKVPKYVTFDSNITSECETRMC